jgi:hypothetical protein
LRTPARYALGLALLLVASRGWCQPAPPSLLRAEASPLAQGWAPSSRAQALPVPDISPTDFYRQGLNTLHDAGVSVILAVTFGGYTFQDNKVTSDDPAREDKSDTKLSDGNRFYPVVRLSFRERHLTTAKWNADPWCEVGYRVVTSAGWYSAGREFNRDEDGDGTPDKSRFRVRGEYLYAAPELVARFLAPEPGDKWSLAVAVGAGLSYSHLRGKVKNPHNPDADPKEIDQQGFGPALALHVEASIRNFVIIGQYENVDLVRGDRLYVSGFLSAGVGYLGRF